MISGIFGIDARKLMRSAINVMVKRYRMHFFINRISAKAVQTVESDRFIMAVTIVGNVIKSNFMLRVHCIICLVTCHNRT